MSWWIKVRICVYIHIILLAGSLTASAAASGDEFSYASTLRADRWDEDWSRVGADAGGVLRLKRLRLPFNPDATLILGGETRLRAEARDARDFGLDPQGREAAANLRLLVHGDLQFEGGSRIFAQIGSWDQRGRDQPRIYDESRLVAQRLFFDWRMSRNVVARVGRQDLFRVRSRLLIPVDVFNAQLVHDAVTIEAGFRRHRARAFIGQRFLPGDGLLDERDLGQSDLWGLLYEGGFRPAPRFDFGVYLLAQSDDVGLFPRRPGPETRRSAVLRVSRRATPWSLSLEMGLQRGHATSRDIQAWAFASSLTRQLPGGAELELRVDGASGDRDGKTAESWATPHPVMAYLGRGGDYGATNAIGAYPSLSFNPSPRWQINVGAEWVWRESDAAAFVDPGGIPLLPANSPGSDLLLAGGGIQVFWRHHQQLELRGELSYLNSRGALARHGAEDRVSTTWTLSFRF